MPAKKKSYIDYSDDSIIKASKQVSKMALKNIQPPPIPVDPTLDPNQGLNTQQPVAISDIKPNGNTSSQPAVSTAASTSYEIVCVIKSSIRRNANRLGLTMV